MQWLNLSRYVKRGLSIVMDFELLLSINTSLISQINMLTKVVEERVQLGIRNASD